TGAGCHELADQVRRARGHSSDERRTRHLGQPREIAPDGQGGASRSGHQVFASMTIRRTHLWPYVRKGFRGGRTMKKPVGKPSGHLTPKQIFFVLAYVGCGNATEAAIIAGYAKKTAKEIGYENLTKPHIQAYLDRQVMIRAKQAGITPEHVIARLWHEGTYYGEWARQSARVAALKQRSP